MSWLAPRFSRSIRYRLTVMYSVALFALGALVLAGIYAGLRATIDDDPVSARLVQRTLSQLDNGQMVVAEQELLRFQFTSVETLANERALEQLRRYSFTALGLLFVMSLGVGWIVAGRALSPIGRINAVARDISATDLSRRIALDGPDDELTRLAGTFDQMLDRLDRAFEGQRRFIHEASHELRNPLATIRTNLEVALADPDATVDDLRQTAEIVDRSAGRMSRVVDELLLFARSEVPERELVPVALRSLVADVAEEFAGTAEASAVRLRLDFIDTPTVPGNPDTLRAAVANLVANAIEHAPGGTAVTIGLRTVADGVELTVADAGPGVDDADRERVFQRSWRGPESMAHRPSGSGLGLYLVAQVAGAHGGSVHVETAESGGARFVLRLPSATAPTG